jgi:hypothetical protein
MPYATKTVIIFDHQGQEVRAPILAEAKGRYYVDLDGRTLSVLKKQVKGVAR